MEGGLIEAEDHGTGGYSDVGEGLPTWYCGWGRRNRGVSGNGRGGCRVYIDTALIGRGIALLCWWNPPSTLTIDHPNAVPDPKRVREQVNGSDLRPGVRQEHELLSRLSNTSFPRSLYGAIIPFGANDCPQTGDLWRSYIRFLARSFDFAENLTYLTRSPNLPWEILFGNRQSLHPQRMRSIGPIMPCKSDLLSA